MYTVILNIIDWVWQSGTAGYNTTEQQIIYYICGSVIVILVVVFVDLVFRVFSHFWHGRT